LYVRRVDLGIAGKVAVVTGASRGIGLAVVDELIAEGVKVVGGARDVSTLASRDVVGVPVDLSTPDGPRALIDAALGAHGRLDFLVNNAGAGRLHLDGFASITDEDWAWSFDTNLMSTVRTVRAALPELVSRGGAIVNVSSLNGRIPAVEAPEYSAMKAALNSLSRALALELAPSGVRVNVVSPGPVLTDMQIGPGGVGETVAAATGGTLDDYVASVEQAVPLRRMAAPEEIAAIIVTLLSPRSGYVTGAEIAIDGATGQG
jgi:NAD(P)-dependent dehydrogenase (short-subunit alcohol dehydrogenase family)